MNHKPKTLKQAMTRALVKSIAFTAAAGISASVFSTVVPMGSSEHGSVDRPVAVGSPADIIAKHHCWTGEAPADMTGQVPGHVVVTLPGHTAPTYGGSRLVGQALGQIFDGENYNLTVHGFCR